MKAWARISNTTRTADETTLAKFWGAAPIWNAWADPQRLAVSQHASLERTVTVFAISALPSDTHRRHDLSTTTWCGARSHRHPAGRHCCETAALPATPTWSRSRLPRLARPIGARRLSQTAATVSAPTVTTWLTVGESRRRSSVTGASTASGGVAARQHRGSRMRLPVAHHVDPWVARLGRQVSGLCCHFGRATGGAR